MLGPSGASESRGHRKAVRGVGPNNRQGHCAGRVRRLGIGSATGCVVIVTCRFDSCAFRHVLGVDGHFLKHHRITEQRVAATPPRQQTPSPPVPCLYARHPHVPIQSTEWTKMEGEIPRAAQGFPQPSVFLCRDDRLRFLLGQQRGDTTRDPTSQLSCMVQIHSLIRARTPGVLLILGRRTGVQGSERATWSS